MKTAIQLIAQERQEQIQKHGRSIESDAKHNSEQQLIFAALAILEEDPEWMPNWDGVICQKIMDKPHKERLIVAAALLAAEIDRLNFIGQ